MKAVLVIDIPEDCISCPCVNQELWNCQASKEYIEAEYKTRPERCPLKHLPKKKNTDFHPNIVYANGWNDCLKAITGETEMED